MIVLLGLVFLAIGIFVFLKNKKFKDTGVNTSATVKEIVRDTEIEISFNSKSNNFNSRGKLYPVISFKTKEGAEITKRSKVGSNPSPYKVGQQLNIFYNAKNPEDFIIDNFLNTKLLPYGFMLIGVVIIIVAIAF